MSAQMEAESTGPTEICKEFFALQLLAWCFYGSFDCENNLCLLSGLNSSCYVAMSKFDMIAFAPPYLFVMLVLRLLSLRSLPFSKERFKRGLIKRGGEGKNIWKTKVRRNYKQHILYEKEIYLQ